MSSTFTDVRTTVDLRRFPILELAGEPHRVRAPFLNQYDSIPVRQGK